MTPVSPAAADSGTRAVSGERVACAHCGLPVPASMYREGAEEQFCCHGCESARGAILACGLENYYAMRDASQPAAQADGAFVVFDDPDFLARHAEGRPDGSCSIRLCLEGVHCAACLWLLERLPKVVRGLVSLELDLGRSVATIVWTPTETPLSAIAKELARFGYPPHPVEPSAARSARTRAERRALGEIGVAAACMGNVMLLAFALYSGDVAPVYETMFRWLSAGLGILSVVWPGRVFFRGAIGSIRARAWHLDTPIALALGVGSVAGLINVARGAGEIYFDSITMLVLLLLIGRWLQTRQQHRSHEAVELLFAMTPRSVRLVDEDSGEISETPIDKVERGQLVEVLPERCVPADGVIESGTSTLDESLLTGESVPVERGPGAGVAAGTNNLSRTIRVRVSASGRETRIGKLMETIESLSRSRVPLLGSADRMARPFVMTVLVLAAACLVIHLPTSLEMAIEHTVALLIVVCPCAIALATPLATSVAIGRLASRGILVKGGDVLEPLSGSPVALLDKTGTLTDGRFVVRDWIGRDRFDAGSLKDAVAAIESRSDHPIAAALERAGDPGAFDVEDLRPHTGKGLAARVAGHGITIGSETLVREMGLDPDDFKGHGSAPRHLARVYIVLDSMPAALVLLGDDIRADSARAVDELHARGWETHIVSGDAPGRVAMVAESLGIGSAQGGVSPEGKLERVESLRGDRPVVMVGDGVNDAAALAAAEVGIAVHGGAEASLAAADVYLNRQGMGPLLDLVEAARSTTNRVRLCLRVGLVYNSTAALLALAGLISPIAAAVLMPASSLSVLAIAMAGSRRGAKDQVESTSRDRKGADGINEPRP